MAPPNVKIKHLTRSPGNTRFPKLDECAHFHYENVELGPITVHICENPSDPIKPQHLVTHTANKENEPECLSFLVMVTSNERKWVVRRTYKNFVFLDTQLHRCVYDRKYSLLKELPLVAPTNQEDEDSEEKVKDLLSEYLERFSQLAGSLINCGPVLNWLELDNRGNRLIVTDEVAINTPAVAAAYVIMCYTAQAADEISFDVGDMVSVIDMPPPDESTWWRGKKGYEVGFFPCECVEVIGDKVPHTFKLSSRSSTKPVFRKHGKLIAFFRSFLLSRPSRRKLKQSGILKERVFGCDLGEHLLNTGREIPLVLKCCAEFIEEYGIVDGIYRLSGVNSNIQRLRLAFDEDRATNLGDPSVAQDVHSVASLLKMYFRELPNPLLTYHLYDKFVSAVQSEEDVRILRIRDVVQQLPPPHYRTLQYLLEHLARIASHGGQTGMTPKNIAIVWAPNLLRSREVENGGVGALHVVGVQAVLTEYLIRYYDLIFDEKMPVCQSSIQDESVSLRARPKSLAISTPTKLLSLEEARARALSAHLPLTQQKYIEVGGGPDKLPSKYHTVIDLPGGKHACTKLKKSPSGWKSFFSRGWYSGSARDKSRPSRNSRKASTASLPHTSMNVQEKSQSDRDMSYNYPKKLRTVKSAESLAHCLKEVSPVTSEDDKSRNSPKILQQVSMIDSSCFDSPCSAFPGSPSLQRHTRSSSHESYFENSIDMASDNSVEDDSSLYYFVKEQMQKLQQEADSALWTTNDDFKSKDEETEEQMGNYSKYFDSTVSSLVESGFSQLPDSKDCCDVEKVVRKQKFCAIDNESALAKVQRLSWMNDESSSQVCGPSGDGAEPSTFPCEFPCTMQSGADQSTYDFNVEDESIDQQSSTALREDFPWLQLHLSECDDKPSIYPSSLCDSVEKRYSCISSSDTEAENNSKIVIERYGNAETVLVEVHATQDSSESEGDLSECHDVVGQNLSAVLEESKVISSAEETENKSGLKESSHLWEESFKTGLSDVPCSTMISSQSLSSSSLSTADESSEGEVSLESMHEDEHKGEQLNDFDDVRNEPLNFVPESPNVTQPLKSECLLLDIDSADLSKTSVDSIEVSPSGVLPYSVESTLTLSQHSTVPEEDEENKPAAPADDEVVLRHQNETDLKYKYQHDGNETPLERTKTVTSQGMTEVTAPSTSFPNVPSSPPEVHSLKTRMEHIPLHKKRQILNIPTASSPVEEVRKKFELRAAGQKVGTTVDNSHADHKSQSSNKELPSKLDRRHTEVFDVQHSTADTPETVKRKSDGVLSAKTEIVPNKRHSEPYSPLPKSSTGKATASLPPCLPQTTPHVPKAESKYPVESSSAKSKVSLPSLFTQLKVRKLQSLQGESPTQVIDPWSDPILDIQEDYHPVICYSEVTNINDSSASEAQPESCETSNNDVHAPISHLSSNERSMEVEVCSEAMDSADASVDKGLKDEENKGGNDLLQNVSVENTTVHTELLDKNKDTLETDVKSSTLKDPAEDEATRRERINRIKEERRAQMREKLKSESFRLEAEEKERIQTKFRFRKDPGRQTVAACSFDASDYLTGESKDSLKHADSCEADNSRTTPSGKIDDVKKAGETGEGSESKPNEYSDAPSGANLSACDTRAKSSVIHKGPEDTSKCRSDASDRISIPKKSSRSEAFSVSSSLDLNSSVKRASGVPAPQSLSSPHESKFTSLTDVRDRVAMFERSKDKDLCRAGPNGKFSQKQGPSPLTPSFVR